LADKVTGIVVHTANYGESDRMITIFSPDVGCVDAGIRFIRRPKSKLRAAGQLFCYGQFMLHRLGAGKYTLIQFELCDSFFDLATDLDAFSYAAFLCGICREAVQREEPAPGLFALLLHALTQMCYNKEVPPQDIGMATMLKMMDELGFMPQLTACSVCGKEVSGAAKFSARLGGVLCGNHADEDRQATDLSAGAASMMRLVLEAPMNKMAGLRLTPAIRQQWFAAIPGFVHWRMEKRFKSSRLLEIFHQING
jgi:DNA repair protein RecO (recombination protein O)